MTKAVKTAAAAPKAVAPKAKTNKAAAPKTVAAPKAVAPKAAAPKDAITEVAANGGQIVFVMAGEQKLAIPTNKFKGDILKLAAIGASMASLRTALGQPKPVMANGTNGRVAPHSAKAVADAKGKEAPAAKAPKAATAPKAPKAGDTYKVGPLANDASAGSWRHYMVAIVQGHADRASANAAHAKGKFPGFSADFAGKKLDFGWMAKVGYIA